MRLRVLLFSVALLLAARAAAAGSWPNDSPFESLCDIGSGIAVVFSPDLAREGNRPLYERLGFTYIESADWRVVLDTLRAHNSNAANPIRFVILETHGANGNGLKLQTGKNPQDPRSYISAGALQEALDSMSIGRCYISACNAGRLLRPSIYRALDRTVSDPTFLPATLGFIDASPDFDASRSRAELVRRSRSNLETLIHGDTSELGRVARTLIDGENGSSTFVVSTMLIQLLLEDSGLELTSSGYVEQKSAADIPEEQSERLFQRFLRLLNDVSAREAGVESELRAQPVAARASNSD